MPRKHRIPFADIAKRITGISTPVFGVSWTPPKSKRDIVRRLVTFLEDRRALYAQYHMEYSPWVDKSVLEIRAELTDILKTCPDDELLTGSIRALRAACRKYLDEIGHPGKRKHMIHPHEAEMWQALGELRAVFGIHLARLCSAYGVDVEPELASIFPEYDVEDETQ
jgi:hypothetical protein